MTAHRSTSRTTDGKRAPGTAGRRSAAAGSGGARATRSTARKQATLAIDVGGTGLKASVLDPSGAMEVDRVRVDTRSGEYVSRA